MAKPHGTKKVLLTLPEGLLNQIDHAAKADGMSRSAYIREALKQVLHLAHKMEMEERMRKGYQQMAAINLNWAELGLAQDEKTYAAYEESLSEGE